MTPKRLDSVRDDLRHFFRICRRSPGFAVLAIGTLSLGIGAAVAIFSVINAVLLRPLPYPHPERLVTPMLVLPQGAFAMGSPAELALWREQTALFDHVAGYAFGTMNLIGKTTSEQVASGSVTADFLPMLGAPVLLGRTFSSGEERSPGDHVAVISQGLWKRRFGKDPKILGTSIRLNNQPYLVIGILGDFGAAALRPYPAAPDVWIPLPIDPATTEQGNVLTAIARLKNGVSIDAARAAFPLVTAEFRRRFPGVLPSFVSFGLEPTQEALVGASRTPLWLLAGAVALLLLIACGSVATLLLARASARSREIAIRAALGASRWRIVQQLLTESVTLSVLGGMVGLALGIYGINVILALAPASLTWLPPGATVHVDTFVVVFAVTLSVVTGVVFGLVPALHASRERLGLQLNEAGARVTGGRRPARVRSALVVTQTAMAVVLLTGAVLLIRSFIALRSVDVGFETQNILTLRMSLADPRFATSADVHRLITAGVAQIETVPGAAAAAASCCLPLENDLGLRFIIEGRSLGDQSFHGMAGWRIVSKDYFDVFRIPMVRGRTFSAADVAGAQPVVIISETLARQFWPHGNPIGQRLILGRGLGPAFAREQPREIVGIARDVRDGALDRGPRPLMYVPLAQLTDGEAALNFAALPLAWIVRTKGSPYQVAAEVSEVLRKASGGLPVANVRSMQDVLVRSIATNRFDTVLLTVLGLLATLLAATGIYGLIAYSVQRRTKEIAIRLAVGAQPRSIQRQVVWQSLRLTLLGLAIGVPAALGISRYMKSLLFGVTGTDTMTLATIAVLFCIVAVVAAWLPARRAGRVVPAVAMLTD